MLLVFNPLPVVTSNFIKMKYLLFFLLLINVTVSAQDLTAVLANTGIKPRIPYKPFAQRDHRAFEKKQDLYDTSLGDQTPITLLGETVAGDVPARLYIYVLASTATDDGENVIKPTAIVSNGRWIKSSWAQFQSDMNESNSASPKYIQNKPTYSAGTGISMTGSMPNITVSNTGDLSASNEIQSLSIVGQNLSLSGGGGTVAIPPGTTYTAGTGISIVSGVITNSAPAVTPTITAGQGITITGTWPNLTISLTAPTVTNTAKSFNTSYQNTGSGRMDVIWGVQVVVNLTVLATQSGYAAIEVSANGSTWVEQDRVSNASTLLSVSQLTASGPLVATVPPGYYYRVVTSGNATITTTSNPQLTQF